MKNKNLINSGFSLALILAFGAATACSVFKASTNEEKKLDATNAASTANSNATVAAAPPKPEKKGVVSADDEADFTATAEDLYKEFKADKKPLKGEKYVDKIVEISGRIKEIDLNKKSDDGYQVLLNVGEMFAWAECRVDEDNKSEFAALKKDQQVTLKGLGNKYWLVGPRLKHCVVAAGGN